MTSSTGPDLGGDFDTADAVLAAAREQRRVADAAEVQLLVLANDWADLHPVDWVQDAAVHEFGDRAIPVAGAGVPLVSEFAAAEFAAALGMSTDAGRRLVGEAMELRHRLLRLWDAVGEGQCAVWRARRIAGLTIDLSVEGAEFVDRQLAGVAHTVGLAQLDRLITEARARFEPARARELAAAAAEGRHLDIVPDRHGLSGTACLSGVLDAADALDLDTALRHGAAQLAALGSTESLDVRRAMAAGQLARQQLALDLTTHLATDPTGDTSDADQAAAAPTEPGQDTHIERPVPTGRAVVLHVHLAEAALTGTGRTADDHGGDREAAHRYLDQPDRLDLGRVEETGTMVTAETIRAWCGTAARIVVKPVIDLADHVHVDAYEIPDRIAERTDLRDLHCVFPYCHRPARRCDKDHRQPYDQGGPTCTCNIAALCRRHHRLKTHSGWTYTALEPGTYLWTSPHGLAFLRDHTGTHDVTPASTAGLATRPRPSAATRPPGRH